jgi:hypothetical protein
MSISPFAKAVYGAIVGALVAFLGTLSGALADPGTTFESITDGQWVAAVVAALGALPLVGGTVYQVTNRPVVDDTPQDDEFEEVEL